MVARMLCRSLSWMGWAGLADPAAWEDGAGVDGVVAVGEAVEVAEGVMGVMGVVGTCEELTRLAAEVEVGVAAVDGLGREKNSQEWEREQLLKPLRNMMRTIRTLSGLDTLWRRCWLQEHCCRHPGGSPIPDQQEPRDHLTVTQQQKKIHL